MSQLTDFVQWALAIFFRRVEQGHRQAVNIGGLLLVSPTEWSLSTSTFVEENICQEIHNSAYTFFESCQNFLKE